MVVFFAIFPGSPSAFRFTSIISADFSSSGQEFCGSKRLPYLALVPMPGPQVLLDRPLGIQPLGGGSYVLRSESSLEC